MDVMSYSKAKKALELATSAVKTARINYLDMTKLTPGYYTGLQTELHENLTGQTFYISDYIKVLAGETITVSPNLRDYTLFNVNKVMTSFTYKGTSAGVQTFSITADGYLRVCIPNATGQFMVEKAAQASEKFVPYSKIVIEDNIDFSEEQKSYINTKVQNTIDHSLSKFVKFSRTNLLNMDALTDGYISGSTTTGVATITANTGGQTYKVSDYIEVSAGDVVQIHPRSRNYVLFNINKEVLSDTWVGGSASSIAKTVAITVDGYIRVGLFNTTDQIMVEKAATASEEFIAYSDTTNAVMENNVDFSDTQKSFIESKLVAATNVLYGKKWVACGDSFTAGQFANYTGDQSDYIYNDGGLYNGEYKVYPYIIGRRNNMNVVNEAVVGSTITKLSNSATACFTNARLSAIPADADYITLKFGINDCASAPIGTITDTVCETFYGAWNVTLETLITNHPLAKIGIIITNALYGVNKAALATAMAEVAVKWGIPVLDEYGGANVPLISNTGKTDTVCATAINIRNSTFRISGADGHPTPAAHEYESTIVENFLRSL